MAKGKKAASAANGRLENARDHIDRLTDQLAEAKMRARDHERAAVELPIVKVELARLRQLNQQGTSDALVRAQQSRTELAEKHQADLDQMRDLFEGIMNKVMAHYDDPQPWAAWWDDDLFSSEEIRTAIRFGMTSWLETAGITNRRRRRRWNMKSRAAS